MIGKTKASDRFSVRMKGKVCDEIGRRTFGTVHVNVDKQVRIPKKKILEAKAPCMPSTCLMHVQLVATACRLRVFDMPVTYLTCIGG